MTAIKNCGVCKPHPFQDKKYGENKRVMNKCNNGSYRCTVCDKSFSPEIGKKK